MYLSRIEIDDSNRQKISDLSHLGAFHNWIESSFPDEIANGVRKRHLWRIDYLNGKRYLLLLSEKKPELKNFCKYGVVGTALTKDYDNFINKINKNDIFRFRLTANPTYKTNGKVYPHITEAQQKSWFLKKAESSGFFIVEDIDKNLAFEITNRSWVILHHGRRNVRLSSVSFEGLLQVNDVEQMKKTLINGIGREKAYGMGLLTVIPVE